MCDADDRVGPDWVDGLLEALADHDLVTGMLISWDSAAGATLVPPRVFAAHPSRWYGFQPSGVGASLGFRREASAAVEGLDETLDAGSDDTDFWWRIQLAGLSIGAAPNATILYRLPPTASLLFRKRYRHARPQVVLYARYRAFGMPAVSTAQFLRRWASIIARVVTIGIRERRLRWWGEVGPPRQRAARIRLVANAPGARHTAASLKTHRWKNHARATAASWWHRAGALARLIVRPRVFLRRLSRR